MKEPKTRIVLLTDCLGDLTGGAEKQIFELAKRLCKDKYKVFIASMESSGETSKVLIYSIGCHLRIFRVRRIYGSSGLVQGFKFYSFLRKNSIDVLMTYHFGSDIWGTFWGRLAGVGRIISNRRDMGFWRHPVHVLAYQWINGWVDRVVTVSSSIKHMVIKTEKMDPAKIKVIYNGVDLPQGHYDAVRIKAQLGLNPLLTVIVHVANLRAVKGHAYLLEAFARAVKFFPNARLVLLGKDELNKKLQDQARALGINNSVLFLGQQMDVRPALAVSDICVLPSLSEGLSNAVLEYMSFGKPVITTKVGGNPELIQDGHNGLLVEKENVEQLADALTDLLANKEKRLAMGRNGLNAVKEKFSMDTMVEQYARLFHVNVLHLISSGGLFGAEQVILNLAKQRDDVNSWVGAINNQHNPHLEIIQAAQAQGGRTAVFQSKGRFDLGTIKHVKDFVLKNSINIIHTHNYKSNMVGFLAARWSKKKWVATIHGWSGTSAKLRWYERWDRIILKFADCVVCVSGANYQYLLENKFRKEKMALIFNGVDLDQFDRNERTAHGTTIAIVGRLAPEKGHTVLFKALRQVVVLYPQLKCLVVGDGELNGALRRQVQDLFLAEHVLFTGVRLDMPEVYKECDILVNASFTEGLPMTILEAMACGVAVIATNVGALPHVIKDGKNGILVPPGDASALATVIIDLLGQTNKRKALADQAYQDVRQWYGAKRMALEYESIHEKLK